MIFAMYNHAINKLSQSAFLEEPAKIGFFSFSFPGIYRFYRHFHS